MSDTTGEWDLEFEREFNAFCELEDKRKKEIRKKEIRRERIRREEIRREEIRMEQIRMERMEQIRRERIRRQQFIIYFISRTESVNRPVSQDIIDSRTQEFEPNEEEKNNTCSICLDNFNDKNEMARRLPCGHFFHKSCIDRWYETKRKCPMCRHDICE